MEVKLICTRCHGSGVDYRGEGAERIRVKCRECRGTGQPGEQRPIYIEIRPGLLLLGFKSVEMDGVIIDYDQEGKVCGIEVLR